MKTSIFRSKHWMLALVTVFLACDATVTLARTPWSHAKRIVSRVEREVKSTARVAIAVIDDDRPVKRTKPKSSANSKKTTASKAAATPANPAAEPQFEETAPSPVDSTPTPSPTQPSPKVTEMANLAPMQPSGAPVEKAPRKGSTGLVTAAPEKSEQPKSPTAKKAETGDLKYATPVPGKDGFVYSPGTAQVMANILDVRGLASGNKARDPKTGQVFLVP